MKPQIYMFSLLEEVTIIQRWWFKESGCLFLVHACGHEKCWPIFQGNSFVMHLGCGQGGLLPTLAQTSTQWHQAEERAPLRSVLMQTRVAAAATEISDIGGPRNRHCTLENYVGGRHSEPRGGHAWSHLGQSSSQIGGPQTNTTETTRWKKCYVSWWRHSRMWTWCTSFMPSRRPIPKQIPNKQTNSTQSYPWSLMISTRCQPQAYRLLTRAIMARHLATVFDKVEAREFAAIGISRSIASVSEAPLISAYLHQFGCDLLCKFCDGWLGMDCTSGYKDASRMLVWSGLPDCWSYHGHSIARGESHKKYGLMVWVQRTWEGGPTMKGPWRNVPMLGEEKNWVGKLPECMETKSWVVSVMLLGMNF